MIDKSIIYVHVWADESELEIGDYCAFEYLFEDPSPTIFDTSKFGQTTDVAAVERYRQAEKAFHKARYELMETMQPVTEVPTLPPVPRNHVNGVDAWYTHENDTEPEPCGCRHWHADVCGCGGQCPCHWRE